MRAHVITICDRIEHRKALSRSSVAERIPPFVPFGPFHPVLLHFCFQLSEFQLTSLPLLIPSPESKRGEIGFHTIPGDDSVARGEETAVAAQRSTPGASEKRKKGAKI
jgi:hypothetical protein